MGPRYDETRSDLVRANDEEQRRHEREKDAIHIATSLEKYDSADRTAIRKRVQELLRCKDDAQSATVTITTSPRPLEASLTDLLYAAIQKADAAVARYDCPEGRMLAYLLRHAEEQRRLAAVQFDYDR